MIEGNLFVVQSEKARKTTELELHDSEQRLNEATSLANRAIAERKKYEADAMQFQAHIVEIRQELKITDERVGKLSSILFGEKEKAFDFRLEKLLPT